MGRPSFEMWQLTKSPALQEVIQMLPRDLIALNALLIRLASAMARTFEGIFTATSVVATSMSILINCLVASNRNNLSANLAASAIEHEPRPSPTIMLL